MKYFSAYIYGILIVLAGNAAAARVYTIPEGRMFTVDGAVYTSATTHMWATGSKHVLATDKGQDTGAIKSRYIFQNWQYTGGVLSSNPIVTITADPTLKEFYATFSIQHALSLNISLCTGPNCLVPGRVLVNDIPATRPTRISGTITDRSSTGREPRRDSYSTAGKASITRESPGS
jgi:hypothetical protein